MNIEWTHWGGRRHLESNIFPWLGAIPIKDIQAPELLATLHRVEARGAIETAKRIRQYCSAVFQYAVATGKALRDPAADIKKGLTAAKVKHFAAITDSKSVAGLLRAVEEYQGSFVTTCALKLAPLVFLRPGELRGLEWSEIDLEAAEIRIRAERMKMRREHIVPLARQAIDTLKEIQSLTGTSKFVFPSERTATRPMSENTVNAALRRLGYSKAEMTGHGFRTTASTMLNEQGWPPDVIETQLAHVESNKVRRAYNRAKYLPERVRMMQAWADYLDSLKSGAKITPIRRAATTEE